MGARSVPVLTAAVIQFAHSRQAVMILMILHFFQHLHSRKFSAILMKHKLGSSAEKDFYSFSFYSHSDTLTSCQTGATRGPGTVCVPLRVLLRSNKLEEMILLVSHFLNRWILFYCSLKNKILWGFQDLFQCLFFLTVL